MNDKDLKLAIQSGIRSFSAGTITDKAITLFETLGYKTRHQNRFPQKTFLFFKERFLEHAAKFNEDKALVKEWKSVDLLFQLTKDELSDQQDIFGTGKVQWKGEDKATVIETYLFFAIELEKSEYTRTTLAQITREINKVFSMPVMIVFKHGESLTVSVINRRLHKKNEQKDVLEKVTLIKDISIKSPHRAHIEILFDLSLGELRRVHKFTNFVELHNAWQKTLDTKELNKRFYRELSNWYFWALQEVSFPGSNNAAKGAGAANREDKIREHNAKNLIRLLTRILFVWFVKEKNLIPDELFDGLYINANLINGFEPRKKKGLDQKTKGSTYYRAILQNLFFATLNQTVGKRDFRKEGQQMNVTNLMRYESYFKNPKLFLKLVEDTVPFMNGGLFECLDSPDAELKGNKGGDVIIYEDGFSDRKDNSLCVPDYIFFGMDEHADLSEELDDKKQKDVAVSGLINILKSYKFTVTENTPIEEDVALDPELLGRVFENLLASYNPETKTTARKQTGSFYTPREIVNYMVDESIKAYLKQKLEAEAGMKPEDLEGRLDALIGYNEKVHLFTEKWTDILITAIDNCKILDPACGSGAFPMGVLHKLVHILYKLDPNNDKWRELQRQKAIKEADDACKLGNKQDWEDKLKEIVDVFEYNSDDYARKLYIIENCIYGVDIQPIAIQISKLRFFISLIVDQKADKSRDNFGIRPLPNLETKFVAANTLIGVEKPKLQISLFDNKKVNDLEEKLKNVRHLLFSAKTPSEKRKLREEDQKLRDMMGSILEDSGWSNDSARQLAGWDPYNQNTSSPFFDPEWMFGITDPTGSGEGGFDLVIGNPPYVQLQKDGGKLADMFKDLEYKTFERTGDIYSLFYENGINILKKGGHLCFITSNKWMRTAYGESLREYFIFKNPRLLIDLGPGIFENATVDTNILIIQNDKNKNTCHGLSLSSVVADSDISSLVHQNAVELLNLTKDTWFIGNNAELKLKSKIEKTGHPLKNFEINIFRGLLTGLNEAFIIDTPTKKQLCKEDPKSVEILKQILRGRDIKRYGYDWAGLYVIATFPSLEIDIKKYPAIKTYLMDFGKDRLDQVGKKLPDGTKSRKKTGNKWFETQDPISYYQEFKKEKVVWKRIGSVLRFGLDYSGLYCQDSTCIMTGKNLKYICAYMNSKLGNQLLFDKAPKTGTGDVIVSVQALEPFLIPPITKENNHIVNRIETTVDKILASQKKDSNANITPLEKLIDEMVYSLYDLTAEEIAIVEKKGDK